MVKSKKTPLANHKELKKAIKSLNKGKSADIYGITVEHLIYAGEKLEQLLLRLINLVFKHGCIPDILKKGLLTPVFKNKGDRCHAANYRGITVLPVVYKIVKAIIRDRIQPRVLQDQNPTPRGFTAKSSTLNTALVMEEVYRENVDSNQEFELVLLDVKSAFDVVPLRYKIYKEGNQEICNACSQKEETVEHLLIECKAWDNIRRPVINDIESLLTNHSNIEWESLSEGIQIQILMDITMVQRQLRLNSEEVSKIEHQARRLIFLIHSARCKLLLQP
ncbi:unnamed protein product [Mytilus coruscus]|uniref:Uncharacterized protein n=1 Tax=Mytilus coruscus TaxID=42192 RepID=A0A6J8CTA0_MYTCO|nr:unnamed protein product [Mytilus coruscus]